MDPAEIYTTSRARLLDLADDLTPEQEAARLRPTPPWTVVDGYRHLTGVCCDVLDGNMPQGLPDGAAAWTAEQLASRADLTLDQVCEQWADPRPRARRAGRGGRRRHGVRRPGLHGPTSRTSGTPAELGPFTTTRRCPG